MRSLFLGLFLSAAAFSTSCQMAAPRRESTTLSDGRGNSNQKEQAKDQVRRLAEAFNTLPVNSNSRVFLQRLWAMDRAHLEMDIAANKLSGWAPPLGSPDQPEFAKKEVATIATTVWLVPSLVLGGSLVANLEPGIAMFVVMGGTLPVGTLAAETVVLMWELTYLTRTYHLRSNWDESNEDFLAHKKYLDNFLASMTDADKANLRRDVSQALTQADIKADREILLSYPSYGYLKRVGAI